MTVQVNVYEAKTNLSKLLDLVQRGERVIISKNGTPVADLVFHQGMPIEYDSLKDEIRYDAKEFDEADDEIAALWDPELEVEVSRDPR